MEQHLSALLLVALTGLLACTDPDQTCAGGGSCTPPMAEATDQSAAADLVPLGDESDQVAPDLPIGCANGCDDQNPCTLDNCAGNPGVCQHTDRADGEPCKEAPGCIGECFCKGGTCHGFGPVGQYQAFIPPGKFWMGCNATVDAVCEDIEKPQHEVTLTKAYWIDRDEVTVGLYWNCMNAGKCPAPDVANSCCASQWRSDFRINWRWGKPRFGRSGHPANCINWDQAQAFAAWAGGRLPTEAEWERAARGGCEKYPGQDCRSAMPKYPWGNEEPVCGVHAVFEPLYLGTCPQTGVFATWPVCSGSPGGTSPYGLFDMAGNVREWVTDCAESEEERHYGSARATDPLRDTAGCKVRIVRGGGCGTTAKGIRASGRLYDYPTCAGSAQGFRTVRPVP